MNLNEKHKPDVVLEVDGVQFHCRRDELATQSPYFKAMFSNNFVEKHKDVIPIQVHSIVCFFFLSFVQ